jgi:ubiquitin C-terminal hydrolase
MYQRERREKNAVKQQRLSILPPILVFHLERLEHVGNARSNLNSVFTFPFELEMPIENEVRKYSLYGVILHTREASTGHCISILKLDNR